jgi:hypothetical protein
LGFEDIDFCWRVRLYGKRVSFVPKSIVYHKGSGTSTEAFDNVDNMHGIKNIILPFDPVDARTYLNSTKNGKTIIVLNTDKEFRGGISSFLCIQPENEKEKDYDSIESSVGRPIEVSGTIRDIKIKCPVLSC